MGRKTVFTMLVLAAAGSFARTALGQILVDHQPHPFGGPSSDTAFLSPGGSPFWQRLADDFVLANASTAASLYFWGFFDADNPPATETMRVRIYGARISDGLPDESNIVSETTIQNPTREATGQLVFVGSNPHEYRYKVDLDTVVSLKAGSLYWLEVVQLGDFSAHFRWEDSVEGNLRHSYINPGVVDWRTNNLGDRAFQLISPEPASIALLALGLVLSVRRR